MYEDRFKIILLQQVSSHDFEPTFNILVLIGRVKPEILCNLEFNPELSIQFRMYFPPKNLKSEKINHDLNHDMIF